MIASIINHETPATADAQVVRISGSDTRHAVGFNLGYFAVRGEDSRVDDDVLLADLNDLAFEVGDFSGFTFGGEYLFGLSDYLEVGAGRDDGMSAGEHSSVLVRPGDWRIERSETRWLSDDPGTPGSVGWDAHLTRVATLV